MKMNYTQINIIPGCEEKEYNGNEVGCLLIHGFRSCPFEMGEYAEFLNALGFTVKTCLLPGHGTSPADLLEIKWEDWVMKVEDFYRDLQKQCKKIFIAGLSTGGSLALYLASIHQVDGIIALAPGLYLKQKFTFLSHILKYIWKYKKIKSGPDISIKVESKVYPKVPVASVSQLLCLFKALKKRLTDIKAPVLIVYSTQDHVVKSKSSKKIYNTISSQNKKLLQFEKSYHILTMDIERKRVFSESRKFINDIISK